MKRLLFAAAAALLLAGCTTTNNYLAGNTYYELIPMSDALRIMEFDNDSVRQYAYSRTKGKQRLISSHPYRITSATDFTIGSTPATYNSDGESISYIYTTYTKKLGYVVSK